MHTHGVSRLTAFPFGGIVMPRPCEQERRPERIAIKGGIVRCYYRSCYYTSGPHLTRTEAVSVAREHHERIHAPRRWNRVA